MAYIAQNITEISKIIGCSEQFYKKQNNQTDPYYESTMYLVNNGEYINSQQGYISNAGYPHINLPNFSSLLKNNVNYIQFIAYSNADKKFHLFSCNSAASQYCSVTASGTVLNVYTNLYHCQCYHYSYTPGDENWVEISHWAYNNTLNYSKNEPFKVVWCSSNFVINFTDTGDIYTFCPDLLEADPVEGKYFACFYDVDGTYLNNDIYIREDLAYTDLYYGARKLSDTLICQNYPDDPGYPNDKIYLQPRVKSGGTVYGYRVYFKHDNFVIPLATTDQLILVEEVEEQPSVLKMTMTINGETVQANVLCVNDDGTIPSNIYEPLYTLLYNDLSEQFNKVLRWQSFSSILEEETEE